MPIEVSTDVNNLVTIEVSTTSPETPEISIEVPEAVVSVDTTVLLGPKGHKGDKGATGDSGVYVGTTEPTNPDVKVWLNPDGTQGKTSQLINDGEGTEPFITDSDVGNGTITFTQEGSIIGTITTNQKINSTIAIGQSGTKVIWRIWE